MLADEMAVGKSPCACTGRVQRTPLLQLLDCGRHNDEEAELYGVAAQCQQDPQQLATASS